MEKVIIVFPKDPITDNIDTICGTIRLVLDMSYLETYSKLMIKP